MHPIHASTANLTGCHVVVERNSSGRLSPLSGAERAEPGAGPYPSCSRGQSLPQQPPVEPVTARTAWGARGGFPPPPVPARLRGRLTSGLARGPGGGRLTSGLARTGGAASPQRRASQPCPGAAGERPLPPRSRRRPHRSRGKAAPVPQAAAPPRPYLRVRPARLRWAPRSPSPCCRYRRGRGTEGQLGAGSLRLAGGKPGASGERSLLPPPLLPARALGRRHHMQPPRLVPLAAKEERRRAGSGEGRRERGRGGGTGSSFPQPVTQVRLAAGGVSPRWPRPPAGRWGCPAVVGVTAGGRRPPRSGGGCRPLPRQNFRGRKEPKWQSFPPAAVVCPLYFVFSSRVGISALAPCARSLPLMINFVRNQSLEQRGPTGKCQFLLAISGQKNTGVNFAAACLHVTGRLKETAQCLVNEGCVRRLFWTPSLKTL